MENEKHGDTGITDLNLRGISDEALEDRFTFHSPSGEGVLRHEALSAACIVLSAVIDTLCPASREKSMALSHVQEAKMCASASVALNEKTR